MKKELNFRQKIWYALGMSTGRQFITALVSTYILVFLTDTFGVPAGAAGVIMTIAAVWDAINDPIMGTIADRTKSRWGTYRPWLLFIPLPLSIVSVLLFAAPELTVNGKIVYAAVLYICYGMLVTAIEIPYNAILPTMSKNEMERNDVISITVFISSIMILLVSSFTPNFVQVLGGDNPKKGYMLLVLIAAVVMLISTWGAFATCKEKYTVDTTKTESPFKGIGTLLKTKEMYPMIGFWCSGCLLFQIIMASSVYYCMYYLMNPGLIASYMLVISVSGMVGVIVVMPIILRVLKGSIKKAATVTQIISAIGLAVCFVSQGKSIPVIYIFTAISSMFATMTNAFRNMSVVGMIDYVLLAKGEQLNGTIAAINGFAYKCGTAISNAIIAGVLAVTAYIPGAIGQQTPEFMVGINSVRFLGPLIATVLYVIFVQFYPEKKMREFAEKKEN